MDQETQMDRQTLMDRLDSDGSTGLDLSPGDPIAAAAAKYIRDLEKTLEIVQFELSPGTDAARSLAARVRVARRSLDRLPLIGSPASGGTVDG
jgi:hypothetical protein